MRFLLDQNQSPAMVPLLAAHGHDAVHVREVGLSSAPDRVVLATAAEQGRVLVSADNDFSSLLAQLGSRAPSLMLLRRQSGRRAAEVVTLVIANLNAVEADLAAGAVVVIDSDRVRVRRLPM